MRLIDADEIFDDNVLMIRKEAYDVVHAIIEKINNAPTVDAEPVVRCKDCIHNSLNRRSGNTYCEFGFGLYQLNDFCSRGKRREDAIK